MTDFGFAFDNSYARELDGFYVPWQGEKVPSPEIIQFNTPLARELGLDPGRFEGPDGAKILCGATSPAGAAPLAQVYAGHQFGGFSPQLGDGRALLIGEVIDPHGIRRDIHLKGSGPTPFSRGGDGKAVLGPVLREYLIGEAMHALGIPTTRALAATLTGETIMRDGPKPGAVLARVASSHLRVGTFQFFAARGEVDRIRLLAEYAIGRHYPVLADQPDRYPGLLRAVSAAQASLIARWMLVGFVHGVMNTDNMTISGETIDYGPCAFIDAYHPASVFSSIDHTGRYAYANQPVIAQWNLARFAETLLPLIDADRDAAIELATAEIERFPALYFEAWLAGMRAKTGLLSARDEDAELLSDLLTAGEGVDYTTLFRTLPEALSGNDAPLLDLAHDPEPLRAWLPRWRARLVHDPMPEEIRRAQMDKVNPLCIPRNHLVEEALTAAETRRDLEPFERLLSVVSDPFTRRAGLDAYTRPAPPEFGPYRTYCGT